MRSLHACKALIAALLLASSVQSGLAHEGHDHGDEKPAAALPAAPRGEASSDAFELVAVAKDGELTFYLERFATNEPITDAALVAETPDGSKDAVPAADGTYRLAAPWLAKPGHYDIIATVTPKGGPVDILSLAIEIPSEPAAPAGTSRLVGAAFGAEWTNRLTNSGQGLVLSLAGAFVAGVLVALVFFRRRSVALAVLVAGAVLTVHTGNLQAHEGHDHDEKKPAAASGATRDTAQMLADGSIFVPKSTQRILAIRTAVAETAAYKRTIELPGRIIPDPDASGYVQAAVGGRLSPPDGGFPRLGTRVRKGDMLAHVTPPLQAIDISDMRQRQGELDQQISIVERRLQRYESLAPSGAIARSTLEETRLELQGLKERRASLDKAQRNPEALVSPVDGVIADGTPVAGQIVQNNAIVFHVIDPSRLWVEALSYEAVPVLKGASARVGSKALSLAFRGAGFADRNQSIPIHFAVEGDTEGLRAGQFVTVFADMPDEQRGIAVPRTSIVRTSAGQDAVFEHVAAERFAQRSVRLEPLDGERVLVSQGLEAGRRVVVQGAELLDHIR